MPAAVSSVGVEQAHPEEPVSARGQGESPGTESPSPAPALHTRLGCYGLPPAPDLCLTGPLLVSNNASRELAEKYQMTYLLLPLPRCLQNAGKLFNNHRNLKTE